MSPWILIAGAVALVILFRRPRTPSAAQIAAASNATGQAPANAVQQGAQVLGSVASLFGYKPQSTMSASDIATKAGSVVVQGINGLVSPAEAVEPYAPQAGNDTQAVIDYSADFGGDAGWSYTGVDGVPTVEL